MKFALLLTAVVLLALSTVVTADNLYPACSSTEKAAAAGSGQSATVVTFEQQVSTVYLLCFAYEVTSIFVETTDYCAVPHQTDYPFRLTLRATYTDGNGTKVVQDYDIKDYKSGSIDATTVYLPQLSTISIEFINLGVHPKCALQIREIHDFLGSKSDNASDALSRPVLVATYPRTIATEDNERSNFILRYTSHEYVEQASQAEVAMMRFWENCSFTEPRHKLDLNAQLPNGVVLYDKPELYQSFSTVFSDHHATTYVMCYRKNSTAATVPLGSVTVYTGNPSYYEFIEGLDEDGRLYSDVPVVAKFYGHDLDTRPNGDRAKLVIYTEECTEGKPAGGVPETHDLGPADDFGPNTTFTLWSFTVLTNGAYKMCYLRAGSSHWTEVPYITDVDGGRRHTTTVAPDEPVPYDPETDHVCPTVPPFERRQYKAVKLTLRQDKIPGDFVPALAKFLCIAPSSIQVISYAKNSVGKAVIHITIHCDDGDKCNTEERYSYLNYLSSTRATNLTELGIVEAKGEKSVAAFEYDTTPTGSSFGTFLWAIVLLALGGGGVYLFMRYKERREYFGNFNLDDGEVDDMYDMYDLESGGLPGPTTDASHIREDNHYVIHDAVIEMEE